MEGCFTFQWGRGGVVFQMGGASFLGGVLMGGSEKNRRMGGGAAPMSPSLWEPCVVID